MAVAARGSFDPETLALLKSVFNRACTLLPQRRDNPEMRSTLAVRILRLAGKGERNPTKLLSYALDASKLPARGPRSRFRFPNQERGVGALASR